jgi:hypothetical protein
MIKKIICGILFIFITLFLLFVRFLNKIDKQKYLDKKVYPIDD